MKILGIETSCDETAMAVLEIQKEEMKVLSNVVSSQVKLHAQYGGVVPNLAAREHVKNIDHVFNMVLKNAGVTMVDIDLIAVTRGPGLGPALVIGLAFAKALAWKHNKPIIGTNHMEGHIYSNWLSPISKIEFPILNLIVSGGHTELVLMTDHCEYKLIGETKDDAVGEAFDKVARLMDLGYPGGPIVSKMAEDGNPERYPLPSPMIKSKDFNFSYSGLKTAVLYLIRSLEDVDEQVKKDICASFQKAAVEVLINKTIAAAKKYQAETILLSGGVSANKMLRNELSKAALENGFKYGQPAIEYTTDNAAMIAVAGYMNYKKEKPIDSFSLPDGQAGWQSVQMDPNMAF